MGILGNWKRENPNVTFIVMYPQKISIYLRKQEKICFRNKGKLTLLQLKFSEIA